MAQWIRPWTLNLEVPCRFKPVGSSRSALGQGTLSSFCLVPWKGLRTIGPVVACSLLSLWPDIPKNNTAINSICVISSGLKIILIGCNG